MDEKWRVLSEKLEREPNGTFLGRNAPEELAELHQKQRAVILEVGGTIIACGFLFDTPHHDVLETGTLWVDPEYRETGLSSIVFRLRLQLARRTRKKVFTISHEPKVGHLALNSNFTEETRETWVKAIPFACTCGPCDRVEESQKGSCPFRAVPSECRLFVLKDR